MTVEDVLIQAAKAVPSLAVLAFLVWGFLRHLGERNVSESTKTTAFLRHIETRDKALNATLDVIGRDSHEVQVAATNAIRENTASPK